MARGALDPMSRPRERRVRARRAVRDARGERGRVATGHARRRDDDGGRGRGDVRQGGARGADGAGGARGARREPSVASGTLETVARDTGRPGGVEERSIRGVGAAEERVRGGGNGSTGMPRHGNGDRDGEARRKGADGWGGRTRAEPRGVRYVQNDEFALLASGAVDDVRGEEHWIEPSGADRSVRDEG